MFLLWWLLRSLASGIGTDQGTLTGGLLGDLSSNQGQNQQASAVTPTEPEPINPPTFNPTNTNGETRLAAASNTPPSALTDLGDDRIKGRPSHATVAEIGGSRGVSGMFAGGRGSKFVYVLDKSSSMAAPGRFESVIAELIRQLGTLRPSHEFYVIFFDEWAHPMPATGLQRASPQNLRAAITWLRTVRPNRGTDPTDAVLLALDLEPDTIWILSDGEFPANVVGRVNAANRTKQVSINTIAFHNTALGTLKPLAESNGGTYRHVPSPYSRSRGWPPLP
ncbi:MAG TPA: hypothetical protein PKM43_11200 [Verrucomicrobiota bacterium]|nr:hypothetical protein [Verrucomicrobiota bacterium]